MLAAAGGDVEPSRSKTRLQSVQGHSTVEAALARSGPDHGRTTIPITVRHHTSRPAGHQITIIHYLAHHTTPHHHVTREGGKEGREVIGQSLYLILRKSLFLS